MKPDSGQPTKYPGVVFGSELGLRYYPGDHVGLLTARHATTPMLCFSWSVKLSGVVSR